MSSEADAVFSDMMTQSLLSPMDSATPSKFEWDYNLRPVTVVAILNFKFEHADDWPADCFLSSYRLREDSNHEEMTDVLRFVFLELGRFKKKIWELDTVFDKGCTF